jgi:hypothetical protein
MAPGTRIDGATVTEDSIGFAESRKSAWMRFAVARLKEASTYRGLMLIFTALGVVLRPEVADAIITVGVALAGLAGVLMPDTTDGQP